MNEDKQLVENFLKSSFDKNTIRMIEFQLNAICNLKCEYCYYGSHLNSATHNDNEEIIENINIMLNYFYEMGFLKSVDHIDVFSGEPLIQRVGREAVLNIVNFISDKNLDISVTIPSNGGFVANDDLRDRVENLINYSRAKNVRVGVSLSFDGKYMDYLNRPGANYTDDYYDKLFSFAKEFGCGVHPMIYYNNIEKWIDNFLWFQDMFKKYNIPWNNIYLLEVRNDGWDYKSSKEYKNFVKHVLYWALRNIYKYNKEDFMKSFIFDGKANMNIFNNFARHSRGIGCSMQSSLQMRMNDLTVNPCHRLSYSEFDSFKFIKENGKIVDIEPLNLGMYFATRHFNVNNLPFCQDCMINNFCSGGCVGSQFEANSDPFVPIQSVCVLEHAKITAQVEFLVETGLFTDVISRINEEQKRTLIEIENSIYKENYYG